MNESNKPVALTQKQQEALQQIIKLLNENNLTVIVEPQVKFVPRNPIGKE